MPKRFFPLATATAAGFSRCAGGNLVRQLPVIAVEKRRDHAPQACEVFWRQTGCADQHMPRLHVEGLSDRFCRVERR